MTKNTRTRKGRWAKSTAGGEIVKAFLPPPLPPKPPIKLSHSDLDLMERANRALGRLDGLATLLPDISLFVYMYVRKEAVLSSQIEGTQSSLSDLLKHEIDEASGVPLDDVQEVSNYVAAMQYGLSRLNELPLSLRLLKEIHAVLLSKGRGAEKSPGEFRRTQNWIGGSRPGNAIYVPPPPDKLMHCLDNFEKFLHDLPERIPLLIKTAMAHAQFETIHPFLDGNGRLGRLLITLLLCSEKALSEPVLYLSLYFKQNRTEYYNQLQKIRTHGTWEEWLRFFFKGILETSKATVTTAKVTLELFKDDRKKISKLYRTSGSALLVHDTLKKAPIINIQTAAKETELAINTAATALQNLVKLGIAKEITGRQRDRLFSYEAYINILAQGTEL